MDTFYNRKEDRKTYDNLYINSVLWQKYYKQSKYKKYFDSNGIVLEETFNNGDITQNIFEEFFMFRLNYAILDKSKKNIF